MRGSLALALAILLVPIPWSASGAPEEPTRFAGVLSGGGFGLHVAKVVPWRAYHEVDVAPGATGVRLALAGSDAYLAANPSDDLGLGPSWFVALAGPDGEILARSADTRGAAQLEVGWGAIDVAGFGRYQALVECNLCASMAYTLDVAVPRASRGANLSLDESHLLVVPGDATETSVRALNTGAAATTLALSVEGAPAGWSVVLPEPRALAPGAAFDAPVRVTPPPDLPEGARVAFDLVASDAQGELARVPVEATYSLAIAQARREGHAVVAVVEFENANPYHRDFRGPASLVGHPEYVMTEYPDGAQPLPITLDAATYEDAIAADAATWAAAKPATLYYVPGTRFIGFISFGSAPAPDAGGHATGTTSLAAGALGEAPDAYIVSVGGDFFRGLRWAARQPWIDAVSMSVGIWAGTPTVGVAEPAGAGSGNLYVPFSVPYGQKLAYESGKRVFTGSSQGWGAWVGTSDGTVPSASASGPCPYTWAGDFTGSPWTFAIETYWPWTELPWRTSCNPDLVAKGWDLVAASPRSLDGHNGFGHASGATPQTAGAYVRLIQDARDYLDARQVGARTHGLPELGDGVLAIGERTHLPAIGPLSDGVLTVREAERIYLHGLEQVDTAESFARHGDDPRWQRDAALVAPGAEYASEGYGLLTPAARALMRDVMRGETPEPLRAEDDAAYAAGWAARQAFWAPQMADEVWVF